MSQAHTLEDIFEIVSFIKDNAVTKDEFGGLKNEFKDLKKEVSDLTVRLTRVESQMTTKEYMDEKMFNLRGDLVVMTRQEGSKLKTLTDILGVRKIITPSDQKKIFALEPFARV